MRPTQLTRFAIVAATLLAAPVVAEPRPAAQPVATEQVSGGTLTVTPTQPSVASRLSVSGPQGYEATVWSENGGAVSVNLMAAGRFPVDESSDAVGTGSVLDGRHLPDGRYRYEMVFYSSDGRTQVHSSTFFVEAGAAIVRERKQTQLERIRADLAAESKVAPSVGGEALAVDDFITVFDTAGDGGTVLNLLAVGTDPVSLWNREGDFRFEVYTDVSESRATITGDTGRLGIGTTNPQADLHIFRPGGNIRITDSDVCPNPNASWDIEEDFGKLMFEVVGNCAGDSTGGKMWIHGNGNVGIGTNNPVEELEVAGAFPTIRFNDTSGILQVWDIDADSGNFLVQDVTNLAVPLLIEPGTPSQTLRLHSNGRVGVGTSNPSATLHVAGSFRADGDVALHSSRAVKTGFGPVSPAEMLARVADLPVASWRYKTENEDTRHIGPFAEDFQRLFGVGDGKTISVIDAQGVTLAAIQGLQQELAEKDAQIADLTSRLSALEARQAVATPPPQYQPAAIEEE